MNRLTSIVCVLALAACGNISRKNQDGGNQPGSDAAPSDAHSDGTTQMDAPPQLAPTPAREVVSGGGHMQSATYKLDVEIGVPMAPQKMTGAVHTMQPNTAVQQ